MKISNMHSPSGNRVANQFLLSGVGKGAFKDSKGNALPSGDAFQSYDSVIVFKADDGQVYLDEKYWKWSATTSKYRSAFLYETTKETESKIKSGEYQLTNLNP